MTRGAAFRGQPLVVLGVLLAGWVGVRVTVWQSPFPASESVALTSAGLGESSRMAGRTPGAGADASVERDEAPSADFREREPPTKWLRRPLPEPLPLRPGWERLPTLAPPAPTISRYGQGREVAAGDFAARRTSVSTVVGHNFLMMAGLQGELPAAIVNAFLQEPEPPTALARRSEERGTLEAAPGPAGAMPNRQSASGARWSADAWVLLREDSKAPLLLGQGAYGRSQAGAVVRYRLAPSSGHAPQAYVRGSAALATANEDVRDREVALGVSARPVPSVPVRVAAEARVTDTGQGTSLRPAVYAVTELSPVRLPFGTRGELYLQGGYVGGDFATGFVDGQARVEKPLGRVGPAEVFAGAAAWGGAQEGASRLDVGPSAGATIGIGGFRGRLTADYRFRVAGDSRPASGPALTLYAGF